MEPDIVATLLGSLLDESVQALEITEGARDAPPRRYVAHGTVTWDCEQLTAHLVRLNPKLIADSRHQSCAVLHIARLAATLLQCYPAVDAKGVAPSAAAQDEAGRQLAIDGWAIWKHLTASVADGSWPEGINCRNVEFISLEPLAPSGGLAGWRITVDVRL